jgi:carbonic anhydrase/acetyltransferase-like protein (isoleucine patch superfamily)
VTEGKEFPDNSLIVGAPAKVIRQLGDDTRARHLESAKHYVENGQRYLKGLEAIEP